MVNVKIDENCLIGLLNDRLNFWSNSFDDEELRLFSDYFGNAVRGGGFEGIELDVMSFVDNFVVNDSKIFFKKDLERSIMMKKIKLTNKKINLALKWFWDKDIPTNVSKASGLKNTYDEKVCIWVKGYQIQISDLELELRAEEIMKQKGDLK